MGFDQQFNQQIAGPLSYEELEKRCVTLIRQHSLRHASIDVTYSAKEILAYTVCIRWTAGLLFRRQKSCSAEFRTTCGDRLPHITNRIVDVDATIFCVRHRIRFRHFQTIVSIDLRQPEGRRISFDYA